MLCPICQRRRVRPADPEFPFCSERCRLTDLGNWAAGNYPVSIPLPDALEPEAGPRLARLDSSER